MSKSTIKSAAFFVIRVVLRDIKLISTITFEDNSRGYIEGSPTSGQRGSEDCLVFGFVQHGEKGLFNFVSEFGVSVDELRKVVEKESIDQNHEKLFGKMRFGINLAVLDALFRHGLACGRRVYGV